MRDLLVSIQEDIERGVLSFTQIANKHRVPLSTVDMVHGDLMQSYVDCDSWYDEQYELDYE